MSTKKNIQPAPYDWHAADQYLPRPNEIVRVHQLTTWAVHDGENWLFVDDCGNRGRIMWTPEYWRREWRYHPPDPTMAKENSNG